jgi:hypothetical protein
MFLNLISRSSTQWRSHLSPVGPPPICDCSENVYCLQQSYHGKFFTFILCTGKCCPDNLLFPALGWNTAPQNIRGHGRATWRWHFVLTLRYSVTAPSSLMTVRFHAGITCVCHGFVRLYLSAIRNCEAVCARLQPVNCSFQFCIWYLLKQTNSMVWARERTIPTERPPLVGEVIANFWGWKVPRGQRDGSLRPYSRFSRP